MADEKYQKHLKHTVDFSKEHKNIVSHQLMHIAKEDKKNGLTLGTFNLAWAGESAITDSVTDLPIPPALKDLDRVVRGGEFLAKAIQQNPELDLIALQESASVPIYHSHDSAETAIKTLTAALEHPHTPEEQEEIRTKIEKLQKGNLFWEKIEFKKIPGWAVTSEEAPSSVSNPPRAILYNSGKFNRIQTTFNLNGLPSEIRNRIQIIQLQTKEDPKTNIIVYNVHFPASIDENPKVIQGYISQIRALQHNSGKTVCIMGDFNSHFPSTDPAYVNNGTSVVHAQKIQYYKDSTFSEEPIDGGTAQVIKGLRKNGQRNHDCPNAIFVGDAKKVTRLKTQIVNFKTGKAEDLPTVSLETAIADTYFFPVPRPEEHQIKRFDDHTGSLKDPMKNAETALKENKQPCGYPEIFLEKNMHNLSRVVINAQSLTAAQKIMLKSLGVTLLAVGKTSEPADLVRVERFVLYPHIENDFYILYRLPDLLRNPELEKNPELLKDPEPLKDANFLNNLHFSLPRSQSSARLKRWAKILAVTTVISTAASLAFFFLFPAFVPAVFLAATAGILGIIAGVLYTLGKHRGNLYLPSERPLAIKFAAIGITIAIGATLAFFFAPAVAFAGIVAAPAMLAFAVAAIFLAAALAAALSKNSVVPSVDPGPVDSIRADDDIDPVARNKSSENFSFDNSVDVGKSQSSGDIDLTLKASLLKNEHGSNPKPHERKKKSALTLLTRSRQTGYGTLKNDSDSEGSDQEDQKSDKSPAPSSKKEEESATAADAAAMKAMMRSTDQLHRDVSTVSGPGTVKMPQAKVEEEALTM